MFEFGECFLSATPGNVSALRGNNSEHPAALARRPLAKLTLTIAEPYCFAMESMRCTYTYTRNCIPGSACVLKTRPPASLLLARGGFADAYFVLADVRHIKYFAAVYSAVRAFSSHCLASRFSRRDVRGPGLSARRGRTLSRHVRSGAKNARERGRSFRF